jgi:DtxR family Mn-dependent transcriptional regulator
VQLEDQPLTTLVPGESGTISRITPESTLLLTYLADRDLRPGCELSYEEAAPFNGPMMIRCNGQSHALGQEIAAHIFVTRHD